MTRGIKTTGREYLRVVEWSPEDRCFEMPLAETAPHDPSRDAVTPDAQRFLVLTTVAEEKAATPPLTVVLNYAPPLER